MSTLPLSADEKAAKWGTITRWAFFAGVGYLVSPIILATIQGMLGLIVVGAICGAIHFLSPVFQQAAMNLRLKMIKAEAAKNPIETLENEFLRRSTMLDERKHKIETFDAKTRTFGDKLDQFKRDYPSDAPKFQITYDQMMLLLKKQRLQWKEAAKGLQDFAGVITRAKAMYAMALAANEAKQGSGLDEDAFYAQLKTETALDSIQDGMNQAFSQLDTLVLESDNDDIMKNVTPAQQSLPSSNNSNIIDINVGAKSKTA